MISLTARSPLSAIANKNIPPNRNTQTSLYRQRPNKLTNQYFLSRSAFFRHFWGRRKKRFSPSMLLPCYCIEHRKTACSSQTGPKGSYSHASALPNPALNLPITKLSNTSDHNRLSLTHVLSRIARNPKSPFFIAVLLDPDRPIVMVGRFCECNCRVVRHVGAGHLFHE